MNSVAAGRRVAVAAAVVGVHVWLVVAATQDRLVPPVAAVAAMTVFAVAERITPPTPDDAALAVDLSPPDFATAPPNVAAPPAACDLPDVVGRALQDDPAVAPALTQAAAGPPTPTMLWNGGWSAEPVAVPLRRAIGSVLATARADCLDEVLTGPRLIFLHSGGATVSIAVGSGTWRWRELMT